LEVGRTGSGSCPINGFGFSRVETYGSIARMFAHFMETDTNTATTHIFKLI